jgi:hypothetical protein
MRIRAPLRLLIVAALTAGLVLAGTTVAFASGNDTAPAPTTTTASALPAGAVVPKVSLSAPKPGRLVARTPRAVSERLDGKPVATYKIKAGHPVTWWYSVSDPNGRFAYGIIVFKSATAAHPVAGDGTRGVYHQTLVQKRWTWANPGRGLYRVCAQAGDMGPVRGGMAETCQLVQVG